jgi:hypothetical protein
MVFFIYSITTPHMGDLHHHHHQPTTVQCWTKAFSPSRSIFDYSHSAPVSRPAQIVTPPGLRESYTTFTETRSPIHLNLNQYIYVCSREYFLENSLWRVDKEETKAKLQTAKKRH